MLFLSFVLAFGLAFVDVDLADAKTIIHNEVMDKTSDGIVLITKEKEVTQTTSKKVVKKTKKLKKKAKKTRTKTYKNSNITKTWSSESGDYVIDYEIEKQVIKKTKYTKGKKKYKVTTTKKTIKHTIYNKYFNGEITNIEAVAPKVPKWLIKEFKNRGFKLRVDLSMDFYVKNFGFKRDEIAGMFWGARGIDVKYVTDYTVYHELGHFLDWCTCNIQCEDNEEWNQIFKEEAAKCSVGDNPWYGQSSPVEYFATSYSTYVQYKSQLKKQCPKTYNFIERMVKMGEQMYG